MYSNQRGSRRPSILLHPRFGFGGLLRRQQHCGLEFLFDGFNVGDGDGEREGGEEKAMIG